MANNSPDTFREIYDQAGLDLRIAESRVTIADDSAAYAYFESGRLWDFGLQEVLINQASLPAVVGRPLIMNNPSRGVLSPAIVTLPDHRQPTIAQITQFRGETFQPKAGLTAGQHLGVSIKAGSRTPGFGDDAGGILLQEPGHFGGLLVAASDVGAKHALMTNGDTATHNILDNPKGGLPEALIASAGLHRTLGAPVTKWVDFSNPDTQVQAFWHPDSMQIADGLPLRADYPGSTQALLGAAINEGGQAMLDSAYDLGKFLLPRPGI